MGKISKIEVDADICVGCGTCASIAPEVFKIDDTGKSSVKDIAGDSEENIIMAAHSCPVKAIRVLDENGEEI